MQYSMYEKRCPLPETEQERKELETEIKHLRWKKNHAAVAKKYRTSSAYKAEKELAEAETLLALYNQEVFYPFVGKRQQMICNAHFLVSCEPCEIFLPIGALQKMPDQVRAAYERAVACGVFSNFFVMTNVHDQDYVLLAWRKGECHPVALVARWGETFASWDRIVSEWLERKRENAAFSPLLISLLAGIASAAAVSAYFHESGFPFAADRAAAGTFLLVSGGTRLGYYLHDRALYRSIPSPF